MTNFRKNIQRVNNSNSIVYNGDVYVERLNERGVIAKTLSDKKPGERMGYLEDGAHTAAINELNGWLLEDIIPFDDAFNYYIKSHLSLDETTSIVCDSIGIRPDDNSEWANDIRTIIRKYICHFDKYLENEDYFDKEEDMGNPDKLNQFLTVTIFNGLVSDMDAFDIAEDIRIFK